MPRTLKPLKLTDNTCAPEYPVQLDLLGLSCPGDEAHVWFTLKGDTGGGEDECLGIWLTPAQARKFAAGLIRFADAAAEVK